jgi:rhodanese-related sulfurtransferase
MQFLRAIFGGSTQINVEKYRNEFLGEDGKSHVLLDIRNPNEYSSEHIEGAINIPLNKLTKKLHTLPPDTTIVCVCRSGSRSREAAHILQNAGYKDVLNLMGGTMAWRQSGGKVVRGN